MSGSQPPANDQPATQASDPDPPVVAVIGNPNTGKSTLFNTLTGLRQKTANFPGVTVEKHTGLLRLPGADVSLVDLPGTYSLAAQSPDEMIATDVLHGEVTDVAPPSAVLIVADAANLRRNLFLASQILELDLPVVVALNMDDIARAQGVEIDTATLAQALDARVVPVVATSGQGIPELRAALSRALTAGKPSRPLLLPDVRESAQRLADDFVSTGKVQTHEVERALIDKDGQAEKRLVAKLGPAVLQRIEQCRMELSPDKPLAVLEAEHRYAWINALVDKVETRRPAVRGFSARLAEATDHPFVGIVLFVLVMATVFQAVFAWAAPLMDAIDSLAAFASAAVQARLPPGAVASLLTDGVIAGVGSVLIFLPQILILFAFIILLEDSGYMARAAFLMDRAMRACGLSGQSFIPMLSSFACAVPGIMATRVIPGRRDRLATIIAAPFMTCSARLPIYALLIAAFVPRETYLGGFISLHGLVLLGLYLLGIAGGIFTAALLKKTLLRGPAPSFLIELPPYRLPNLRSVAIRLVDRCRIFLRRAGTVIFAVAVLVWALAYFPRPELPETPAAQTNGQAITTPAGATPAAVAASEQVRQSLLGRIGMVIEPAFRPLGWDWRISAAVVAGFPAREVVVAVMATIYAVGDESEGGSDALAGRLQSARWPDGAPVFTLATALGLLVFYAFCLQCVATIAVIRRETNTWRWPLFAWTYMTGLGYAGAWVTYEVTSLLAPA